MNAKNIKKEDKICCITYFWRIDVFFRSIFKHSASKNPRFFASRGFSFYLIKSQFFLRSVDVVSGSAPNLFLNCFRPHAGGLLFYFVLLGQQKVALV